MNQLGNFLVQLRKENQITQEELGYKLDIPYRTVSRWESGRSIPSIENFILLSDFFNITVDELIRGRRNNSKKNIAPKPMENVKQGINVRPMTTKQLMSFIISLIIIIVASGGFFILRLLKEDMDIPLLTEKGIPAVIALSLVSIGMFIIIYQVSTFILIKNKSEEILQKSKKYMLFLVSSLILFFQIPSTIILLDDIYMIVTITLILSVGVCVGLMALNSLLRILNIYNDN